MAWHASEQLPLHEKARRLAKNGLNPLEIADRLGVHPTWGAWALAPLDR